MIKITNSNAAKIEAMLAAVNGRSTAHTHTEYHEIAHVAEAAERRLESLGIQKAARAGAALWSVSGGPVPNAYKYSRQATGIRLERRATGWFFVSASPVTIWKEGGSSDLLLTEEQDARAVAALRMGYRVQRPAAAIAA